MARRKSKRSAGPGVSRGKQIKIPSAPKHQPIKLEPAGASSSHVETGVVYTCGNGHTGQLGMGLDIVKIMNPQRVEGLQDVVDIVAGAKHTICLNQAGNIFTWGRDESGALGYEVSTPGENTYPHQVGIPETITRMTAGSTHSSAQSETGSLYVWGSFADSMGTFRFVGDNQSCPTILQDNVCRVASGSEHLLFATRDAFVYSCGNAESGQLGRVPKRSSQRSARSCKLDFLLPLDVIVRARGRRFQFDEIWAGHASSFIRCNDNSRMYGFGSNECYQLGLPLSACYYFPSVSTSFDQQKEWKQVCCSRTHTLCLDAGGMIYGMGRNDHGCLGMGIIGDDRLQLQQIPSLQSMRFSSIACNNNVSFAVTIEGDAYAWGMGCNNQLGFGEDESDVHTPKKIKCFKPGSVIKIAAGEEHTVFLIKPERAAT